MTAAEVREILRQKAAAHGSARKAARAAHVDYCHFLDVLNGRRNPGPHVLRWVGLQRVFMYEEIRS